MLTDLIAILKDYDNTTTKWAEAVDKLLEDSFLFKPISNVNTIIKSIESTTSINGTRCSIRSTTEHHYNPQEIITRFYFTFMYNGEETIIARNIRFDDRLNKIICNKIDGYQQKL